MSPSLLAVRRSPFAGGPNGGGTRCWREPTTRTRDRARASTQAARSRAARPSRGTGARRSVGLHGEPPFEARPPRSLAGRRASARGPRRGGRARGVRRPRRASRRGRGRSVVGRHAGPPFGELGAGPRIGVERRAHLARGPGGGATSPCPAGSRGCPRPPAAAGRGSDEARSRPASPGSSRTKPRSSWSRSTIADSSGRRARHVDRGELDVDAMAPEPARLIDAGADEQPVEPGVEAIGVPERGQITPGADERVLDGVLGLVGVPEDEPGGAVQTGDRGACQHGEGVMIAPPRSLHEIPLHRRPSAVARPA